MFVETFQGCFRQFYFLTQIEYYAWAIAFALLPFLTIFEMLSFFDYKLFFSSRSLHRTNIISFLETCLSSFMQFYVLTQSEYFGWL